MLELLKKRQYNNSNNKTNKNISKLLEKKCVKELKKGNIDYFKQLLDTNLYKIIILIDGKEDVTIENMCHNIQILFINHIQNNSVILQNLLLVDIDLEDYYFMTTDGSILQWDKTIKRNQIGINHNEIVLDPYLLLSFIDETQISYTHKLTKYILKLFRNLFETIATYIIILCYMFFQCYLLFKSILLN